MTIFSESCRRAQGISRWVVVGGLVATSTIATGCTLGVAKQYERVRSSATALARTDAEALRLVESRRLEPGAAISTTIDLDDARLQKGDTIANYELFAFAAKEGTRYVVELRSLCDCFGIDKYVLYPDAYLLDTDGNVLEITPQVSFVAGGWSRPVHIRMRWTTIAPRSETVYLLVRADNQALGKHRYSFQSDTIGYDPIAFPLWAYPTGKIEVQLSVE